MTYEMIAGYLRGFGISMVPAVLTMLGVCGVRIVWVYTAFAANRTFDTLLLAYPLSLAVTAALHRYGLTERHARALLRLGDGEERLQAAEHMGRLGLNVAQAEAYIDRLVAAKQVQTPRRRPTYIIKDVRLFLNSVERGVQLMRGAGVGAQVARQDTDSEICLTVRIPKRTSSPS